MTHRGAAFALFLPMRQSMTTREDTTMHVDTLLSASPTLDQMHDAIARFYCGESKNLIQTGPNRWAVAWACDDEIISGVEVRRVKDRYHFIMLADSYPTELTPAGEQAVIPGCERQPVAGKPAQLSLFGG